jgi:hypothetical protein
MNCVKGDCFEVTLDQLPLAICTIPNCADTSGTVWCAALVGPGLDNHPIEISKCGGDDPWCNVFLRPPETPHAGIFELLEFGEMEIEEIYNQYKDLLDGLDDDQKTEVIITLVSEGKISADEGITSFLRGRYQCSDRKLHMRQ